jgi:hypothetical protein
VSPNKPCSSFSHVRASPVRPQVAKTLARRALCEKASIDEVYLDVTQEAKRLLGLAPPDGAPPKPDSLDGVHLMCLNEDQVFCALQDCRFWGEWHSRLRLILRAYDIRTTNWLLRAANEMLDTALEMTLGACCCYSDKKTSHLFYTTAYSTFASLMAIHQKGTLPSVVQSFTFACPAHGSHILTRACTHVHTHKRVHTPHAHICTHRSRNCWKETLCELPMSGECS